MTYYVRLYPESRYENLIEVPFDTLDKARNYAIQEFRKNNAYEISANGKSAKLDIGSPRVGIGISKSRYGIEVGYVVRSKTGLWFWVTNQEYPTVKILSPVGKIVKTR